MKKVILLLLGLIFLTFSNQAQTVTDYDGNVYDTVNIGNQVWLKQNLKTTHYNNGVSIPNVSSSALWLGLYSGARCYYNNDSAAYDAIYGALYNWYAVVDTNKICPTGWHVATNAEWQAAETYLGGDSVAGGAMKEAGTLHWLTPNYAATNSSGFTALPGGGLSNTGDFQYINEIGFWWTSTSFSSALVWGLYMWNQSPGVEHDPVYKNYGVSLRCIRDADFGLNEIKGLDKIHIYPNPASDHITIDCDNPQNLDLHIYNIVGEVVLQRELHQNKTEIDLSNLAHGMYIVKVIGADQTIERKIIKD
jgi:uncharacterized protein (TIGR02145 family)